MRECSRFSALWHRRIASWSDQCRRATRVHRPLRPYPNYSYLVLSPEDRAKSVIVVALELSYTGLYLRRVLAGRAPALGSARVGRSSATGR